MTTQRKLQDSEIPSFETCCLHIVSAYAKATRNQHVYNIGWFWYNQMNEDCDKIRLEIRDTKPFTLKQTVDTVAITSPAIPWESNKKDAASVMIAQAMEDDLIGRQAICAGRGVQTPYGWQNHIKAWRVLDGLITFDKKPTCLKTWNFGQCAENPDTALNICIDQHIVHIAINDGLQGSISIKARQYKFFEDVIRHVAGDLGILPSRLQAIVWQQRQYELGYMVDMA